MPQIEHGMLFSAALHLIHFFFREMPFLPVERRDAHLDFHIVLQSLFDQPVGMGKIEFPFPRLPVPGETDRHDLHLKTRNSDRAVGGDLTRIFAGCQGDPPAEWAHPFRDLDRRTDHQIVLRLFRQNFSAGFQAQQHVEPAVTPGRKFISFRELFPEIFLELFQDLPFPVRHNHFQRTFAAIPRGHGIHVRLDFIIFPDDVHGTGGFQMQFGCGGGRLIRSRFRPFFQLERIEPEVFRVGFPVLSQQCDIQRICGGKEALRHFYFEGA